MEEAAIWLATVATLFVVPVIYTLLRRGAPVLHELDSRFEAEARGGPVGGAPDAH